MGWRCKDCGCTKFTEMITGGFQYSVYDKNGEFVECYDQELDFEDIECAQCGCSGGRIKEIAEWVEEE